MCVVSIIVPVYNAEKRLKLCIESILKQTYKNFELILIDDGSKDASFKIMETYQRKFSDKIRVFTQANQGVIYTRQRGIKVSKGNYLFFVDNDDTIENDYIETYLHAITRNDADCVVGGYRRVTSENTLFNVKPVRNEWFKFMVLAPWAHVYKKDFIVNHQIHFFDYGIGEDVYFNLAYYTASEKVEVLDYIGYNWYFNEKSVSNTSQRGLNKELNIIYFINAVYDEVGIKNEYYLFFYNRYLIWYLLFSGRNSSRNDFLEEYKRIVTWLQQKGIKLSFPVFSNKVCGEKISYRLAIFTFLVFHKFKLMNIFANFYARGEIK